MWRILLILLIAQLRSSHVQDLSHYGQLRLTDPG